MFFSLHRVARALTLVIALGGVGSDAFAVCDVSVGIRDEDLRIVGRDADDETGSALAVGDVSGDGIGDILIGVPRSASLDNTRPRGGEVAVVLGALDHPPTLQIRSAAKTFWGATVDARLGTSVAVGDVDGDGVGDIIMGAPEADGPGALEGAAYVFYGGTRLIEDERIDLNATRADLIIWGGESGARMGHAIAVGDFNGDRVDDIATAAPREGDRFSRPGAGAVYIFFGRPGLERGLEILPGVVLLMTIHGPLEDGIAGQALAARDVNGDGFDDLVIGVPLSDPIKKTDSGAVYVVFGGPGGPGRLVDLADARQVDLQIKGPFAGDRFGLGLGLADINGDGTGDLLIGAPESEYVSGLHTGRAYAIFGRPFQRGTVMHLATESADVTLAGPEEGAELGASVSGGDLNGDGFDEWIVGAPGVDRTGQAYRILGRSVWSETGVVACATQGARPNDRAGGVSALGDVNGDGVTDLVFGSPFFDGVLAEKPNSGAVYVLRGLEGPETPSANCVDSDGDGFRAQGRTCGPVDCDDQDREIRPFRAEVCGDGIDNNCDGFVDGDGLDEDGDGFPGASDCVAPDCNDHNRTIYPGAAEECTDQLDNDCDGLTNEGCPGPEQPPILEASCTNCVDDNQDGRADLIDDQCTASASDLELRTVEIRRGKGGSGKQVSIHASLPEFPIFEDPTQDLLSADLTVALAFSDGLRWCLPLARGKRAPNGDLIRRGNRAVLRMKPRPDGTIKLALKYQGAVALPAETPMGATIGIFTGGTQYRGYVDLRPKGRSKLVH